MPCCDSCCLESTPLAINTIMQQWSWFVKNWCPCGLDRTPRSDNSPLSKDSYSNTMHHGARGGRICDPQLSVEKNLFGCLRRAREQTHKRVAVYAFYVCLFICSPKPNRNHFGAGMHCTGRGIGRFGVATTFLLNLRSLSHPPTAE